MSGVASWGSSRPPALVRKRHTLGPTFLSELSRKTMAARQHGYWPRSTPLRLLPVSPVVQAALRGAP